MVSQPSTAFGVNTLRGCDDMIHLNKATPPHSCCLSWSRQQPRTAKAPGIGKHIFVTVVINLDDNRNPAHSNAGKEIESINKPRE